MEFYGLIIILVGVALMAALFWFIFGAKGDDSILDSVNESLGLANEEKEIKINLRSASDAVNPNTNDYDFGPPLKSKKYAEIEGE